MRPRRRPSPGVALLAWLSLIALCACTPLYLPPVPAELPPLEPRTRIADARIDRTGGSPTVVFRPREVSEEGWLAVQWFGPAGGAVASASVWLDASSVDRAVRVRFPGDVARDRAGRWRAVLSMDGRVLRQVEWNETGAGTSPAPVGGS